MNAGGDSDLLRDTVGWKILYIKWFAVTWNRRAPIDLTNISRFLSHAEDCAWASSSNYLFARATKFWVNLIRLERKAPSAVLLLIINYLGWRLLGPPCACVWFPFESELFPHQNPYFGWICEHFDWLMNGSDSRRFYKTGSIDRFNWQALDDEHQIDDHVWLSAMQPSAIFGWQIHHFPRSFYTCICIGSRR